MNEVFESFVEAALVEAFSEYGGQVRGQQRDFLDTDERLAVKPDLTWWFDGAPRAVLDAKYKSLIDRRVMPNADAYQMLAYCVTLGLPRGYLIYAKDDEVSRVHTVKRHGYEIEVLALDVEAEPADLLEQVKELARSVVDSANSSNLAAA